MGVSWLVIAVFTFGGCKATSWNLQEWHQAGTPMWLCPGGLGGDENVVRAELPYPSYVGCFESGLLCDPIPNPSCLCL